MKRIVMASVLVVLLVAPVFAEEKSVGLTLAQVQADRKAMIEAAVAPAGPQTEPFWQTYWEYRGQVGVLNDRVVKVLEEFGEADAALTGDRAAALVLEVVDIEKKRAATKGEYVKKFQDILIPKQVARWYQIERKMDSVIRAEMALSIPFDSLTGRQAGELTETAIKTNREELVNAIVQPSADQEKPFWYEYRKYTDRIGKVGDRVVAMVEEYADSYAALTDQQAERMTKDATEIDAERVKYLEMLINDLAPTLSGKQMVRLMQGELKMAAVVDLALAAVIPLDE